MQRMRLDIWMKHNKIFQEGHFLDQVVCVDYIILKSYVVQQMWKRFWISCSVAKQVNCARFSHTTEKKDQNSWLASRTIGFTCHWFSASGRSAVTPSWVTCSTWRRGTWSCLCMWLWCWVASTWWSSEWVWFSSCKPCSDLSFNVT